MPAIPPVAYDFLGDFFAVGDFFACAFLAVGDCFVRLLPTRPLRRTPCLGVQNLLTTACVTKRRGKNKKKNFQLGGKIKKGGMDAVFSNKFASVTYDGSVLSVVALRPRPADREFSEFVRHCEMIYETVRDKFILALNLQKMHKLEIGEALQWMAMFFRVLPITKQHLRFTCACFDAKLQEHVDKFLDLYNPIKPFYTFCSEEELRAYVSTKIK